MNRYLAGAIGGLLATVPMTLAMEALYRRLPREESYPLPPREITQDLLQKANADTSLDEEQRTELSLISHFGYGAFAGALYPVTRRHVAHPLIFGSSFGVAVWAASYFGWIPALHILTPPHRHPANRRRLMVAAHLVWGAGTVWIGERLANRRDVPPRQRVS
ncbi:DUF1440 domain-containing protein [Halomonas korlensis]|uniref:DUF1440 domain-containing protein n=1 Tax=Halomonas korlensis TaxID=463301 RepID=A0A1I7KLH0_9GAMM|nr:DUF1440 domain-containing protein [Halomonas korlensis]SFU98268.1 hypothetical protein SAMN04487955_1252 [Halomonas korlensis]